MPNTTTPASVASRLTDEEIGDLAELQDELGNSSTSSILRDYVRLRNLNGELRKCLKDAADWACGNPDEECYDCMCHGGDTPCKSESWFRVLAEAEKGESK